jgi:hypothetical protein
VPERLVPGVGAGFPVRGRNLAPISVFEIEGKFESHPQEEF